MKLRDFPGDTDGALAAVVVALAVALLTVALGLSAAFASELETTHRAGDRVRIVLVCDDRAAAELVARLLGDGEPDA